jgi:hypothetical protein
MDKIDSRTLPVEALNERRRRAVKMRLDGVPLQVEGAADVFGSGGRAAPPVDLAPLHAKIGQLALENDFLERALTKAELDRRLK